jgi:hypothetical protein
LAFSTQNTAGLHKNDHIIGFQEKRQFLAKIGKNCPN